MINGGHALNALPQRVTANVNCRMFPAAPPRKQAALVKAIADPSVSIDLREKDKPIASPRRWTQGDRADARGDRQTFPRRAAHPLHADGRHRWRVSGSGGHPHLWRARRLGKPGGAGEHGLNEHMEVAAAYAARSMMGI
jgi:acetylornithine deacetylase/succinyl-diaminopimelate desuccinylase-like protein